MTLYNSISSSLPADTNIIMGVVGNSHYFINITEQSEDNKTIISEFINVLGKHACVNVDNYLIDTIFEANIVINETTDSEFIVLDYELLPKSQQDTITNFVQYIINYSNL